MITAHLPSGYLLGRTAQRYTPPHPWVMPAALLGAILPDFDLIWFFLVDDQTIHHHRYWVHMPLFWLGVALVVLPGLRVWKRPLLPVGRTFFAALFLHLCLDTIAGGIAWGWPFSHAFFTGVEVPATYDYFIWSFIFHWTFSLELMIWAAAIFLYFRDLPE